MKDSAIREDSGTGTFAAGKFGTDKNSTSLMDKTYTDVIIFLLLVRHSFTTFFSLQ